MNIYLKYPKGFYVYAYLRSNDSANAKSGTPYYIGKGSKDRAWVQHRGSNYGVWTPKDKSKIIILEQNLTNLGALALERRLIKWYGRIDNNTGILRNKTDGGDGGNGGASKGVLLGRKQSPEHVHKRISKICGIRRSEKSKEKNSQAHLGKQGKNKNKFRWNDGTVEVLSFDSPGHGWIKGSLLKNRISPTVGFHWWNNGTIQFFSKDMPGPEWKKGQLPIDKKWWNDGKYQVLSVTCPGKLWNLGRLKNSKTNKNKRWWNNGIIQKMAKDCPGIDWIPGLIKTKSI